ncbi:MAG: VOC family protein [Candidatus Limnocylindria bacterium]
MPRPIHFELPADDPERCVRFYTDVFGWEIEKWDGPTEYWLVGTGTDEPGIDGGIGRRTSRTDGVINTIGVDSVDDCLSRVLRSGGAVVREKRAVPGVGWLAYCTDSEGTPFGVMQTDENAR